MDSRIGLLIGFNSSTKLGANNAYYVFGHSACIFFFLFLYFRIDIHERGGKKRADNQSHQLKCAEFPQNVRF